jgi:hypothetical protein
MSPRAFYERIASLDHRLKTIKPPALRVDVDLVLRDAGLLLGACFALTPLLVHVLYPWLPQPELAADASGAATAWSLALLAQLRASERRRP